MFSLFKKKDLPAAKDKAQVQAQAQAPVAVPWIQRLAQGLKKTSSNLSQVFGGAQIDEALFEHLEEALLMSDAGVKATAYLLKDLQVQVKKKGLTDPNDVKARQPFANSGRQEVIVNKHVVVDKCDQSVVA